MKLVMITAGGAGMFCGSCMQDNTLVRTLRTQDVDALLVPTYTPIRVDEENVSSSRVFLGGINVYLDSAIPGWHRLPGFATAWLNRPSVIRWISRLASSTDASKLGKLTIDMLRGPEGPQHREVGELLDYLCDELKPDVILLTNALLSGIVPALRQRFSGAILTMLQGDDIFLEGLTPKYKAEAIALVSRNCQSFDGILTHSQYYSRFMSDYLTITAEKFRQIPLIIDTPPPLIARSVPSSGDISSDLSRDGDMTTIGYFARICPEKGVHHLLDAVPGILRSRSDTRVVIAGYLPEQHRQRFMQHLHAVQQSVGAERVVWAGSPDTREEKFELLRSFDMLCVPTDYHEPKGLYVLEAALCGVESVLPDHGAFPERVADLGFGSLYRPSAAGDLERVLQEVCDRKRSLRQEDGSRRELLRQRVEESHGMKSTAPRILQAIHELSQR